MGRKIPSVPRITSSSASPPAPPPSADPLPLCRRPIKEGGGVNPLPSGCYPPHSQLLNDVTVSNRLYSTSFFGRVAVNPLNAPICDISLVVAFTGRNPKI